MPNSRQIPPFSFQLDIEQCSTDISPFSKLIDDADALIVLDIFNVNLGYGDCTSPKEGFYSYLKNLDRLMNKLEPNGVVSTEANPLRVEFNRLVYSVSRGWPAGVLMANRKEQLETESNVMPNKTNVAVIQFLEYTLVPELRQQNPGDIVIDTQPLMSQFQQLVGLLLLAETSGCAITDGVVLILLEFNLEAIKQQLDSGTFNKRVIPMKLYATHLRAFLPSSIESWVSWYLKCCRGVAERKIMKGLKYLYLSVDETS